MKARTSQTIISSLLFGAILVVTLNAWVAYRAVETLTQSQFWVAHTWQVINAVERVLGSLKDAETGTRGYLLTGDDTYLAPYALAKAALPEELNQLQQLFRPLFRLLPGPAAQVQRQRNIFEAGQRGKQIEKLKNEADFVTPHARQVVIAQ